MTELRKAEIERNTNETQIQMTLNLDGTGKSRLDLKVGFLEHMLTLLAKHSAMDINLKAKGDIQVDFHHLTEDVGIVLGETMRKALGNKAGIRRYGFFLLPMDETLVTVAVDLGGRPFYVSRNFPRRKWVTLTRNWFGTSGTVFPVPLFAICTST